MYHSINATAYGATDASLYQAATRNERSPGLDVKIRMGSLNLGTMKGKGLEIVEMMRRRRLDVLCVQETKWKGDRARILDHKYKMIHAGGDGISNGVGVIVNEEISKNIIRVERWNGRILLVWMMVHNQMICVTSVYGPQSGRTVAEKQTFREALERMIGLVENECILISAGDYNAHIGKAESGEEECVGKFGWGERNREGRDLIEVFLRNNLAVAGTFFQKRESHKVTYRSGRHKSELDLLVVRKKQLWRVKDCKAIAGEFVTTQHKPVIFVIRLDKKRKPKIQGRKVIKWWKCKGQLLFDYADRVRDEFMRLNEVVGDLEDEWKKFKNAFVGTAEDLCGRSSGKGGQRKNQEWWTDEVALAVKEKRDLWKRIESLRLEGHEPSVSLKLAYSQKKNIARRVVQNARKEMEQELYNQLETDRGRKVIYKLAKDRDSDSKDMQGGACIKDTDGKLVTDKRKVVNIWGKYFKDLLSQVTDRSSNLDLPTSVREECRIEEISTAEVSKALKKMKVGKAPGIDEICAEMITAAGEVGIK